MAKLVRTKSQLKSDKNKTFLHLIFAIFLALSFFGVGIVMLVYVLLGQFKIHIAFPIMFLVLSVVLLAVFYAEKRKYAILSSGVNGEQETLEVLKKLPKNYTVINNPVLYNRGAVNELDFVVIGENGVFIVESKNYRGIICGKTSSQDWKQIKHGKNKTYEKLVQNPTKQSHRQGKRMAEMFADFDITADIYPILYFVDARSELKITDDAEVDVTIIKGGNQLVDFILNAKGKETVDDSERAKIIRMFKK